MGAAGRKPAREAGRGRNAHLLAENRSHRKLEGVEGAGHPRRAPTLEQGREPRVASQVLRNGLEIGVQVKHSAKARPQLREGHGTVDFDSQVSASVRGDPDSCLLAVHLDATPVTSVLDAFDPGGRSRREIGEHGGPVEGGGGVDGKPEDVHLEGPGIRGFGSPSAASAAEMRYHRGAMSESVFTPSFEELPAVLPVFPLAGALVLPRQNLPLNIFEPRYVSMVTDALGEGRNFGMIQPLPGSEEEETPALCRVGCAGRITAFNETRDGRFVISLTGVCRFGVAEEFPPRHGYRQVTPEWTRFASDLDPAPEIELDLEQFEKIALEYFAARRLEVKWEAIRKLPPATLVDFLAVNLPLAGEDKQALLECDAGAARADLLRGLLAMAAAGPHGPSGTRH